MSRRFHFGTSRFWNSLMRSLVYPNAPSANARISG
jgi:hypothetical protein